MIKKYENKPLEGLKFHYIFIYLSFKKSRNLDLTRDKEIPDDQINAGPRMENTLVYKVTNYILLYDSYKKLL